MKTIWRFVSFATQALHPRRWLAAAKRRAIQIEVVAVGLLLMPVILVMADHLPFVDVPSGAFYHNAVSAVFGARITTGTTKMTFSPDDLVTRGQMAVFLHRGLGRVQYSRGDFAYLASNVQTVTVLRINTGGAPGGIGWLKVDAAFTAYNQGTTACPCRIDFALSPEGGSSSYLHYVTLYDNTEGVTSTASGAVTMAFPLPTGNLSQNVRLQVWIGDSAGTVPSGGIVGYGTITAIWVPFGATGSDTISAASASPDEAPPGTEPDAKPDAER